MSSSKEWREKNRVSVLITRYKCYEKTRDSILKKTKEYFSTIEGKKVHLNAVRKWRQKNRDKMWCYKQVAKAIKNRLISKPKTCSICGEEKRLQAHHDDYSKPLDIVWCCSSCHKRMHIDRIGRILQVA